MWNNKFQLLCCPRNGKRVRICQYATVTIHGKATNQNLQARIPALGTVWKCCGRRMDGSEVYAPTLANTPLL
jgi:hypothetical protein